MNLDTESRPTWQFYRTFDYMWEVKDQSPGQCSKNRRASYSYQIFSEKFEIYLFIIEPFKYFLK